MNGALGPESRATNTSGSDCKPPLRTVGESWVWCWTEIILMLRYFSHAIWSNVSAMCMLAVGFRSAFYHNRIVRYDEPNIEK